MVPCLLSIPPELLNRIYESCDGFSQVVALASACKETQTVWLENLEGIIWSVGQSQIRSFDDALMAVNSFLRFDKQKFKAKRYSDAGDGHRFGGRTGWKSAPSHGDGCIEW
ncbi:MAG: hypothetical protein CL912_30290 [Deltaproteobacteria bacterium]|nr:hypothetical protein [Deltaproteobacteria bacterium]